MARHTITFEEMSAYLNQEGWHNAASSHGRTLPLHRRLKLYAGGKLLWPWRSAMFKHNKRAKPGPYRRIRPHAMHRMKRPGERCL